MQAEIRDPSSPAWRVTTANHLLNLGEAAKARAKALEVLACGHGMANYEHVGYSLLGLSELALGDEVAALEAFTASAEPARVDGLPASSRDLRLLEGLLSAGASSDLFRSYLLNTRRKACVDEDSMLEARIYEIESRLPSSADPSPS